MGTRRYGRRSVETSNEDKVLFPTAGLTKGDLIDYYERVAERILPHLAGRPLVLRRFPDGVARGGFYQKQASDWFPDWVTTVRVELEGGGTQDLVVCDGEATLAYLANLAAVELHPWLSRRDRLDHPDRLVIDLDPPKGGFAAARRAALLVRELFEEELGLVCYAMLTGSEGVHVVTPLDRGHDFDAARGFARGAMELLAARHPDELTVEQRKDKRRGRLYLDAGRNAYGQTAVAPWSVRAREEAPVAVPVPWERLERGELGPRDTTMANVLRRWRDEPWAGMRRRARSLRGPMERLEGLRDGRG